MLSKLSLSIAIPLHVVSYLSDAHLIDSEDRSNLKVHILHADTLIGSDIICGVL